MPSLKNSLPQAYWDLQSLLVPIYCWKNLLMDFVTDLPIFTDWKRDNNDLILVIVDLLTKMVHYKLFKITIDDLGLVDIIINVVMRYHGLSDLIITDWGSLFTLKFWSLPCYFLSIKQKLSTVFYS